MIRLELFKDTRIIKGIIIHSTKMMSPLCYRVNFYSILEDLDKLLEFIFRDGIVEEKQLIDTWTFDGSISVPIALEFLELMLETIFGLQPPQKSEQIRVKIEPKILER